MENLIYLLATSFALRFTAPKKFKNIFIGKTGCCALLFSNHRNFQQTKTESGDQLYFQEFTDKKVTYGIICIDLLESCSMEEAIEMLHCYIDKLRSPYFILHQTGVQPETDWNNSESRTLVDYWRDGNQNDWKVKGYTDGSCIAVLYVKNISEVEVHKQDLFLDSFHFRAA